MNVIEDGINELVKSAVSSSFHNKKNVENLKTDFEAYLELEEEINQDKKSHEGDKDRVELDDRVLTEATTILEKQTHRLLTLYEENHTAWMIAFFAAMSAVLFIDVFILNAVGSDFWMSFLVGGAISLMPIPFLIRQLGWSISSRTILSRGRVRRRRCVEQNGDPVSDSIWNATGLFDEQVNRLAPAIAINLVLLAASCIFYLLMPQLFSDMALFAMALVAFVVFCFIMTYRFKDKIISRIAPEELQYCEIISPDGAYLAETPPPLDLHDLAQDFLRSEKPDSKNLRSLVRRRQEKATDLYHVEGTATINGCRYDCTIVRFKDKKKDERKLNDKVVVRMISAQAGVSELEKYESECGFAIGLRPSTAVRYIR